MEKETQIRGFVQKQKSLINEATTENERDYLVMVWLGFLNGLRLTNYITWQEYQDLYNEMLQYVAGIEAA